MKRRLTVGWGLCLALLTLLVWLLPAASVRAERVAVPAAVRADLPETVSLFPTLVITDTGAIYRRLAATVARGLSANPRLSAWDHRITGLGERPEAARALMAPELGAEMMEVPLETPREYYSLNFIVQQTFPPALKLENRARVEEFPARMAVAERAMLANDLRREITQAFFELYAAQESLLINRDLQQLVDWMRKIAESRYRVGQTPQQDVWQAQLELSMLESERTELAAMVTLAAAELAYLTDGDTAAPAELPGLAARTALPPADAATAYALQSRPELTLARLKIEEQEAMRAMAASELLPDFTTRVTYNALREMDDALTGEVMFSFPLAPWSRREADARGREAESLRREGEELIRDVANRIRSDVAGSRAGLQGAAERVILFRGTILPQAEQSFRSALNGYTYGQNDFQAVLEAARGIAAQRQGDLAARIAYEQACARLLWAIGGADAALEPVTQ